MLKHITSSKTSLREVRLVFLSITTHYLSYSFSLFIWQWSCWYVFRNRVICNEWLKRKFQLQILGRSACYVLTLASTGHFASFHGTRWVRPHRAVSSLIELELRGKNERVARRERKRLVYKLKVLGQPVTSEVRSSAKKPVLADTLLLME